MVSRGAQLHGNLPEVAALGPQGLETVEQVARQRTEDVLERLLMPPRRLLPAGFGLLGVDVLLELRMRGQEPDVG